MILQYFELEWPVAVSTLFRVASGDFLSVFSAGVPMECVSFFGIRTAELELALLTVFPLTMAVLGLALVLIMAWRRVSLHGFGD